VSSSQQVPLALYVHLPWCVRKCPYCDFNSHPVPAGGLPQRAYLRALLEDLEFAATDAAGREVSSVFFGGGTPSLFGAESIAAILRRTRELLTVAGDVEVSLEANPGTVEHGAFAAYLDAGVNRISLGAQSFDDRCLAALGRIHAAGEIDAAVAELKAAGLDNFNLDLMYGLPGQTPDDALRDVDRAIALGPQHVSHYQLTLEPGTAFARRPPVLPDDEASFAMLTACQARLAAADYSRYEVSAYSRAGRRCRHNLNYWRFGDYLGIGAGAHGKLTEREPWRVVRTARVRQPARYLAAGRAADRVAETRVVEAHDLAFEFLLNALRLVEGFEASLFEARTGAAWASVSCAMEAALERGLIRCDECGRWAATERGGLFLNDLQALFLDSAAPPRAT
jgi:putative oxygen-independent coproporphyrinogen III oxidase